MNSQPVVREFASRIDSSLENGFLLWVESNCCWFEARTTGHGPFSILLAEVLLLVSVQPVRQIQILPLSHKSVEAMRKSINFVVYAGQT